MWYIPPSEAMIRDLLMAQGMVLEFINLEMRSDLITTDLDDTFDALYKKYGEPA